MSRPPDELKTAVESMFRVRAVESPADSSGIRRIWHRGTRGAELVTAVDSTGRVIRQEFTLGDEVVVWSRDHGLHIAPRAKVEGEGEPSSSPARLAMAAASLRPWTNGDRYLDHLRSELLSTQPPEPAPPVPVSTRPSPPASVSSARWAVAAGLAIVVLAILLLLLQKSS